MEETSKFNKFVKELIPYIIIVVVVVLIRTFFVTPGVVNGESMETTLYDGNLVLVNKIGLAAGIDRFDIVVVKYSDDTIIKRVIGLPGEEVRYSDNILYINDKEISTPIDFQYTEDFTMKAGNDEYIVLGDNRKVSKDSRIIGPINIKNIKGKVKYVFFPFKSAKKVK